MQPVQEQEHNWKNVHNTILFWMATWDIKQINTSIISLNIHYYTTFQIQNYISCDKNKNHTDKQITLKDEYTTQTMYTEQTLLSEMHLNSWNRMQQNFWTSCNGYNNH